MKLYKVEFMTESVVAAESEDDAFKIAYSNCREILLDSPDYPDIGREIVTASDLPDGWSDGCIPYGLSDDKTIREILNKGE
jgi:hypothetical protein